MENNRMTEKWEAECKLRGQEIAKLGKRIHKQRQSLKDYRIAYTKMEATIARLHDSQTADMHNIGSLRVQLESALKENRKLRAEKVELLNRNLELEALHVSARGRLE